MDQEKIKYLFSQFHISDKYLSYNPLLSGHINDTFLIKTNKNKYILQRINHQVFKNVPELQNNIERVTKHIHNKLTERQEPEIERKVLRFIPTAQNNSFFIDDEGNFWRLMFFITDTISYDQINSPKLAFEAGQAFGNFEFLLSDLPGGPLFQTIPGFHNLQVRLEKFKSVVDSDPVNRIEEMQEAVEWVEQRAHEMLKVNRLLDNDILPQRIVHYDSKINNILFSKSGQAMCIIDIDTVMNGTVLSDFGDFIRTAANTGKEDDKELENIDIDIDIFKAFTEGYLRSTIQFLTTDEIENLAFGAKWITFMQAVRFLTDYLEGDVYYKTHYPGHNKARALAQFQLLFALENKFHLLQSIINEIYTLLHHK